MTQSKIIYKPLEFPNEWLKQSQWGKISIGLPIIGLDRIVWKKLQKELLKRDVSALRVWPRNDRMLKIRDIVCGLVEEYFCWQNSYFLPDDPCEIVFFRPYSVSDNLYEEEFISVLEEKFGIQWDTVFPLKFPPQMSFGEFVEKIELNSKDSSDQPSFKKKGNNTSNKKKSLILPLLTVFGILQFLVPVWLLLLLRWATHSNQTPSEKQLYCLLFAAVIMLVSYVLYKIAVSKKLTQFITGFRDRFMMLCSFFLGICACYSLGWSDPQSVFTGNDDFYIIWSVAFFGIMFLFGYRGYYRSGKNKK
jgi:hypothetical protein